MRVDERIGGGAAAGRAVSASSFIACLISEEGLKAFVREVGQAMDVWLVDVWTVDHERESVVYEAVWSREAAHPDELEAAGTRVALDERPDLRALLDRGALVERHIDDPDLSPDVRAFMERRGYRTTLDAPLRIAGEVVGVLGLVETREVRRFSDAERRLFERICELASLGVQSAWAQHRDDEHAQHLATMLDSSRRLATSLDQWKTLAGLRAEIERLLAATPHTLDIYLRTENGAFARQAPGADATGEPAEEICDDAPDTLAWRAIERRRPSQARTGGVPVRLVVPLVVGAEPYGYVDVRGTPLQRLTAPELGLLQVLGDHAAVAVEYARLSHSNDRQAAVDPVTGFFNRWYFYERLYSEAARADRYKQPLSILLIGVDGYRGFVMARGQDAGDAVLKAIARLLSGGLRRKVDVACRHGEGEFGLLLPSTPPFNPGAALVAERLRHSIENMEFRNEDHDLLGKFTLSMGVAGLPQHAEDAEELAACAVRALAEARDLGGDRVKVSGSRV